MAFRITMEELGLVDDTTAIEGATPGDVWQQVSKHLKDNHDIKLPELQDVGEGGLLPIVPRFDNASVGGQQGSIIATAARLETDDEQVRVITTRLIEKLRVGQQGSDSSDIVPPGGTRSPLP